jgi:hypothetical protein
MTEWANYDADGKRAPSDSKRAVFRAKEVSVDTGVLPHLVMRAWKASNIGMCTPSIGPTWARPSSHSLGCSDGSRSMLQAQRAHGACCRRKGHDAVGLTNGPKPFAGGARHSTFFTRNECVLGCRELPKKRVGLDIIKTLPRMLPVNHISACPCIAHFADDSTR